MTALYHSMLAPVTYMDVDGRHRGLDGAIHVADGFTNYHVFSLWDTFRAAHPLFTILHPERDADMIRSMLAHRRQSVHGILPVWSFGSKEAVVGLGGGKRFTMVAENLSPENLYVQSARLNGEPYDQAYLRHEDLVAGGTLTFVMGPEPNPAWASSPASAPYSMSRER